MIATVPARKSGSFTRTTLRSRWRGPTFAWTPAPASPSLQKRSDFSLTHGCHIDPGNNIGAKIWTCYDNLPAQAWYYTDDNRIAVTGKGAQSASCFRGFELITRVSHVPGQCLDLTNGNLANSNQVQTYACITGNKNQIWTILS